MSDNATPSEPKKPTVDELAAQIVRCADIYAMQNRPHNKNDRQLIRLGMFSGMSLQANMMSRHDGMFTPQDFEQALAKAAASFGFISKPLKGKPNNG